MGDIGTLKERRSQLNREMFDIEQELQKQGKLTFTKSDREQMLRKAEEIELPASHIDAIRKVHREWEHEELTSDKVILFYDLEQDLARYEQIRRSKTQTSSKKKSFVTILTEFFMVDKDGD